MVVTILYTSWNPSSNAFFNESNDIPIEIEVDFPESIVSRAIEFCYGKIDGIQGFEDGLIEFAEKYSIKSLKEACFESYETQDVTIEKLCPLASAAFKYNLRSLKHDCLDFIIVSNVDISHEKLSELPVEFLVFIAKKYIARFS
uniref:BTB/POZ domain-containing protein n=1 Tax=Panagrolaimus davidi TaxID=227884 RepID=A0A914QNJ8_9BILA